MSIHVTIPGVLGKDADTRQTQGGPICSFSIATEDRVKGEKKTQWVGCAIFGNRGEKLAPFLKKGSKVTVVGRLTMREHGGKSYLDCAVNEIELQGGGSRDGAHASNGAAPATTTAGGGYDDADYGDAGPGDKGPYPF